MSKFEEHDGHENFVKYLGGYCNQLRETGGKKNKEDVTVVVVGQQARPRRPRCAYPQSQAKVVLLDTESSLVVVEVWLEVLRLGDVGKPKAEVAAKRVMEIVSGVDIKPHFCRLEDKPISFYNDFHIMVLGLDSVEARSYINSVACSFLGSYQDSTLIMQLLRDNLARWTSDMQINQSDATDNQSDATDNQSDATDIASVAADYSSDAPDE
ncbi:NEDD8-activating enzyme E1 catalytic subunit [Capsicum chinense]|nr:NEDD8-activating enzyme E1 catalytic subunit [Capsicum chinense]